MQTCDSHSMTRPSVLCSLVILFSLLTPAIGHGQYFGQNKVNYEDFDFKIIKTPHFDVHFYPEEGAAGIRGGYDQWGVDALAVREQHAGRAALLDEDRLY